MESPQGMMTPPTQVAEESRAEVAKSGRTLTQSLRESQASSWPVEEGDKEAATKRVLEEVARLTSERLDKLTKSQKYLKVASSFPTYNCPQAFVQRANDLLSVSISSQLLLSQEIFIKFLRTFTLSVFIKGMLTMNMAWQKFEDMQHSWSVRKRELVDEVDEVI